MSKTFFLVRHGESTHNKLGIIQGQTNLSELTQDGIAQIESTANALENINFSVCFSSPLKRSAQSAEIIFNVLGKNSKQIIKDSRLNEIDFGAWVGHKRDEIKEQYNEMYKIWRQKPINLMINGQYPVKDLYSRVRSFVSEVLKKDEYENILIVGHRGTISALVNILLELPVSHHHFLQIDRGSVTVIKERENYKSDSEFELFSANERPKIERSKTIDYYTEERTKSKGELLLVRHGQTRSNIERKYQGGKNISLSELGVAKMKTLSSSINTKLPIRLFSSPLERAKHSASLICEALDLKTICINKYLHEYLYGVWEGLTETEVQEKRQNEYYQWKVEPQKSEIPEAEHVYDAYNRARKCWEEFVQDIDAWGGSIISVAHDVINRLIICNALDLSVNHIWKFNQMNASLTVIAIKSNYDGRLRLLNHSNDPLFERLKDEWL